MKKLRKVLVSTMATAMLDSMSISAFAAPSDYGKMGWKYMFASNNAHISAGYKGYAGHKGFDIATAGGTTISNPALGFVNKAFYDTDACGYGLSITTVHDDPDTAKALISTFMHMQKAPTHKVGDTVYKGNTIGYVGSTGNSTGNHLHMQVSKDGTWYGSSNVNNFVNPIYFFPNIQFTGDTTIRGINTCKVMDQEYIDKYILDMAYIDYVGKENFDEWLQKTQKERKPHDVEAFKAYFKISSSVENAIEKENQRICKEIEEKIKTF